MISFSLLSLIATQRNVTQCNAPLYPMDSFMTASRELLGAECRFGYAGRSTESSPASGYGAVHVREQDSILKQSFAVEGPVWGHGLHSSEFAKVRK